MQPTANKNKGVSVKVCVMLVYVCVIVSACVLFPMHDTGMCSTASVAQQLSQIRATAKSEQTDYAYTGRQCV